MKSKSVTLPMNDWNKILAVLSLNEFNELVDKLQAQLQEADLTMFDFKDNVSFQFAWADWLQYRKERKLSKYAQSTLKSLNKRFVLWGLDNTVASINQSISMGYQGLFEVRNTQCKQQQTFNTNDRSNWITAFKFIHPYDSEPNSWDEVSEEDKAKIEKIVKSRK